ncbi:hypothetical protein FKM82_012202 [Ascaphus truei]
MFLLCYVASPNNKNCCRTSSESFFYHHKVAIYFFSPHENVFTLLYSISKNRKLLANFTVNSSLAWAPKGSKGGNIFQQTHQECVLTLLVWRLAIQYRNVCHYSLHTFVY